MKNILAVLSSSLLLASCAQSYKRPESIQSKMTRFQAKNYNSNIVPNMPVSSEKIEMLKHRGSRVPASVAEEETEQSEATLSSKKMYFLSLIGQYDVLRNYFEHDSAPTINSCAAFHTSYSDHKENTHFQYTNLDKINYEKRYSNLDQTSVENYPELNLPMTADSATPKVIDILRSTSQPSEEFFRETMAKAINIHLKKTYTELVELCEYGSSDNYYKYENLLTHIQKNKSLFRATKENLEIILRTTIVSNMAVIESFKEFEQKKSSRMPASSNSQDPTYKKVILERMNANWANDYLLALRK